MFITNSAAELTAHPGVAPDEHLWCAVTLATAAPWLLFTYAVEPDGVEFEQTTAIASVLLHSTVESVRPSARRAVTRMQKNLDGKSGWASQAIERIWLANESEQAETGHLIFQISGEKNLRTLFMECVPPDVERTLLFGPSMD